MNEKIDLSQWKNTVLLHNGAAHKLHNLLELALASTTPEVTIDLTQVEAVSPCEPISRFTVQPKNSEINQLPLVLYKHEGRYHALVGKATVDRAKTNQQTQVTGKLLSAPALKKTRIIKPEDVAAPTPASRPNGVHRPHGGVRRF